MEFIQELDSHQKSTQAHLDGYCANYGLVEPVCFLEAKGLHGINT